MDDACRGRGRRRGRRRRARARRSARRSATAMPSVLQPADRSRNDVLRRSSARGPGSARRTGRGPARRAARARSPPSASRRRTGSRTRARMQVLERREDREHLLRASRRGSASLAWRWRGCASTVSVGKTRRSSGTQPMPRARDLVRRPRGDVACRRSGSAPRRAGVRPRIERSVVVLPAPFGPSSATTSPVADRERDVEQHLRLAVEGVDAARPRGIMASRPEIRAPDPFVGAQLGRRALARSPGPSG